MTSRVRAFLAISLDGLIAGPNDELDWLSGHGDDAEDTFSPFFAEIGAMLMGRRTFNVVNGFGGPWPYGETPVLVASSRPLAVSRPTVRRIEGSIFDMVEEARQVAGARDVYLDGGMLFRAALDADLVDALTLTLVPVVLGRGIALFEGLESRKKLSLVSSRHIGAGMVQLRYTPRP